MTITQEIKKAFGLDWRISLKGLYSCLHRLVFNISALIGRGGSRRKTSSIVPQSICPKESATTTYLAIYFVRSARNRQTTTHWWIDHWGMQTAFQHDGYNVQNRSCVAVVWNLVIFQIYILFIFFAWIIDSSVSFKWCTRCHWNTFPT